MKNNSIVIACLCCAGAVCATTRHASAQQEPPGPAIDLATAGGKTGAFQVKLAERSPLSKTSDVAQRMGVSSAQDYDLAKATFTMYVPKDPGADGKFGLMVSLHFKEYGWPPPAWKPSLEKFHLIWIGAQNEGDKGDVAQRIGLMLDAAYNVQKKWPVDPSRVYACISTDGEPACGVDLEYPDVFQGGLHSVGWSWIDRVPNTKGRAGSMWRPRVTWLKRPDAALWNLARARSRFFCVDRLEDHRNGADANVDFANEGYVKSGFKHVKVISVPSSQMGHYTYYFAEWFDEGVQFLDAERSNTEAIATTQPTGPPAEAPKTAAAASSPPKAAPPPPPPAPPAIDERTIAAQRAISLAKSYIAAQSYDLARAKLQKVIADYPGSDPAKEAASLLNEIKDK